MTTVTAAITTETTVTSAAADDTAETVDIADTTADTETTATTEVARAEDVLPGELNLLPLEHKPCFPGQLLPMALNAKVWRATFERAQRDGGMVGAVFAAKHPDAAAQPDFREMGTACRIHQMELHAGQLRVVLAGMRRFRIARWISKRRPFRVRAEYFSEAMPAQSVEVRAHTTAIFNVIKELLPLNPMYREELKIFLNHFDIGEPSRLADFGASLTTAAAAEVQQVLETPELLPRMAKTLALLQKEVEIAKAQTEIRKHVEAEMDRRQREMFLREQLKFIQSELGISKDERQTEIDALREKVSKLNVPQQAAARIKQELEKMAVLERGSAEYTVTRNYLDWLCALPWGVFSEDSLDLAAAEKILNADHEGIKEVKRRILEFIAVGAMKGKIAGSILLLTGPPGVGKTSLGRSVAAALGREFFRFSLGGMHDEAEIKGHRRTYIGAMPGKFVQALRECKTANPVIMLDEIDKIGASFRGDPASALLEVLDPEQNKDFLDHYLDVRVDLSNVLFICTANQLDTIPGPLLDRMETLRLSGYLAAEKIVIARKHLLPRQLKRAGLKLRGQLRIDSAALKKIAEQYAREAGVRKLEKCLGAIARKAAMKILQGESPPLRITARNLADYLGKPTDATGARIRGVGVVTGLAWTALGGATLDIEASRAHGHDLRRGLKLTGQLGDVMKESAEIAYSYVAGNADKLGVKKSFFENAKLHLHVPAGATPKDGPSAGITMVSALISLARGRRVKAALGMSGEISLTGRVLPVGGIREKVIAARRAGLRALLLPEANRGDYADLPAHVKKGLRAHFVADYREVLERLFAP